MTTLGMSTMALFLIVIAFYVGAVLLTEWIEFRDLYPTREARRAERMTAWERAYPGTARFRRHHPHAFATLCVLFSIVAGVWSIAILGALVGYWKL
jgi:hypothetical protein